MRQQRKGMESGTIGKSPKPGAIQNGPEANRLTEKQVDATENHDKKKKKSSIRKGTRWVENIGEEFSVAGDA